MSNSKLFIAPLASINSRKNPWSTFTNIKSIASNASSVTTPNPTTHTRRINERRPIVPSRIVKPRIKRRRANSNATKEDLQATQLRNIKQFANDDDENLIDDIGDDDEILDFSSLQSMQEISQTTSRFSSINGQARKLQSNIWNYYTLIDSSSMKCNYCLTTYKIKGGTHALRNHLL